MNNYVMNFCTECKCDQSISLSFTLSLSLCFLSLVYFVCADSVSILVKRAACTNGFSRSIFLFYLRLD